MKTLRNPSRLATLALATGLMAASLLIAPDLRAQASASNTQERINLMVAALQARDDGDLAKAKDYVQRLLVIAPDDPSARQLLASINNDLARQGQATPASPAPSAPVMVAAATAAPAVEAPAAPAAAEPAPAAPAAGDAAAPAAPAADAKAAAPAPPPLNPELAALQVNIAKQKEQIDAAKKNIAQAQGLAAKGAYKEAKDLLAQTQQELPKGIAFAPVNSQIKSAQGDILYAQATQAYNDHDLLALQDFTTQYVDDIGEDNQAKDLQSKLAAAQNSPAFVNIGEISPNWVARQAQVTALLKKGRAQYLYGDYQGALETYGKVITYDPDNIEAKSYTTRINRMLLQRGLINRQSTRTAMLLDVENAWNRPDVYVGATVTGGNTVTNEILVKLRGIVIPQVLFADAPLLSVVNTLSEMSRQYDAAGTGVNMQVIPPPPGSAVPPNPPVTINLRDQNLDTILNAICRQVGYAYEIEGNIVTIRVGSGVGGELDTRDFPMPQATVTRITGLRGSSGGGGASSSSSDPFASSSGSTGDTGGGAALSQVEEAIKSFFMRAGVEFPTGSNLVYDGNTILVTNTPRQLEKIANILRRYSEIKQVEIESRFLDVQQGVLQELGFRWNISNTNNPNDFFRTGPTPGQNQSAAYGVNNTLRLIDQSFATGSAGVSVGRIFVPDVPPNPVAGTPGSTGFSEPQVTRIPILPGAINTGQGASSVFSGVLGVFDGYKVQMVINALEQTSGADLMSAPKVTVLSQKTAEIVVAQQLRYPTEFSDTQSTVGTGGNLTSGGGSVAVTPGTPQGFEVEQIGVVMEVTPTVEADDSISLLLEPRVTEFEGFIEYGGLAVAISGGGSVVTTPSGFIQPIFSVRQVRTEVTIFDGATVVIGGLTREEIKTVHDKVPILGDIPLIGRAFQSKGETSVKRNLMIFVTANLISPGGSPLRQGFPNLPTGSLFQNATIVTPARAISRAVEPPTPPTGATPATGPAAPATP